MLCSFFQAFDRDLDLLNLLKKLQKFFEEAASFKATDYPINQPTVERQQFVTIYVFCPKPLNQPDRSQNCC